MLDRIKVMTGVVGHGRKGAQVLAGAVLSFILCIVLSADSFAQINTDPDELDGLQPRVERKRRPRLSVGPVSSKRPGGVGEDVFRKHIEAIEAYFTPVAGNIVSADGNFLTSDLSAASGAVPGMRLMVMRTSDAFVHPVTGERVTGAETEIGIAEVTDTDTGRGARLKLVEGSVSGGDVLRLSSAPVAVLFYQDSDVDWDVSEEYYYWLEESGRFRVMDALPGSGGVAELLSAASEKDASLVVTISSEAQPEGQGMTLRQKAVWVNDGKELFTSRIVISENDIKAFKLAGEMFMPERGKPVMEITTPQRAVLMESADLNCDGADEMILSTGTSLWVYAIDLELRPPFGLEKPIIISGDLRREHVWLEAADIDRDGCDELVLATVKDGHEARSFVYDYIEGEMKIPWAGDVFARVIDGELHVQDFEHEGGYRGKVRKLGPASELWPDTGDVKGLGLPAGVDIYDFAFINSASGRNVLAQSSDGHLVIFNGLSDEVLWRSEDSYGGALKIFSRKEWAAPSDEGTQIWRVSDRMFGIDRQVLAIYRVKVSQSAPGLGFSGSGIIRLAVAEGGMREEVMIRDIPRAAVSMAISGNILYVLRDTYSVNLLNLLRGRKIFVSSIMAYSLEGI